MFRRSNSVSVEGRQLNPHTREREAARRFTRRAQRAIGPVVEPMEGRVLMTSSPLVVNTPFDYPAGTGHNSLRNEIALANTATTASTITFDPTVFATPQTIKMSGSNYELSNTNTKASITIVGPAAGVTLDAGNASRIFLIDSGVTATISNLSVTHGSSDLGGAVYNLGTLFLNTVSVSNCTASLSPLSSADTGGGIYNVGIATLTNVSVSSNSATVFSTGERLNVHTRCAGGVFNSGTATILDCTISNNIGTDSYQFGGGSASASGGGVYNVGNFTLTNSTIANNSDSTYGGGGILNSGTAILIGATISGNSAPFGGGINNLAALTTVTVGNSIIAGNAVKGLYNGSSGGPDAFGGFTSHGNNLVGETDGSTGWFGADFTGTVAKPLSAGLGTLANNGGPTLTMLPSSKSPAIDHGDDSQVKTTTDQRGLPRIVNYTGIAQATVDIGAVELQLPVVPTGSITGSVFIDSNADGKLTTGEKGLANAKVFVDANKNGVLDTGEKSATTNSSGVFSISGVAAGTYHLAEVLPSGYVLTAPSAKYFAAAVVAGKVASGFLFADAPATASVSGTVFDDVNANGKQDTGELGLGLWTVDLDYTSGIFKGKVVTETTGANGSFSFADLIAGTYVVKVVQLTGTKATSPTGGTLTLTLTAGEISKGHLFGEN